MTCDRRRETCVLADLKIKVAKTSAAFHFPPNAQKQHDRFLSVLIAWLLDAYKQTQSSSDKFAQRLHQTDRCLPL